MPKPLQQTCILCELRFTFKSFQAPKPQLWQPKRFLAHMQRRRPSRMTLSARVSRSEDQSAQKARPTNKRTHGPFGGMNLKEANIRREPRRRSDAEIIRSSRGRESPQMERRGPEEFKALKMQRSLSQISYRLRNSIKAKIIETDSFGDFALLPSIKDSITTQALSGVEDIIPTPIQRLAIPALLGQDMKPGWKKSAHIGSKEHEQFLLAAETGSGKTLAYLLQIGRAHV